MKTIVIVPTYNEAEGLPHTKGSLHFPIDQPLPASLLNTMITTRLAQLGLEP